MAPRASAALLVFLSLFLSSFTSMVLEAFDKTELDLNARLSQPDLLRGWLRKQGEKVKSWKRRYFEQDRASLKLFYYESDSGTSRALGFIELHEIQDIYQASALQLDVVTPSRIYHLQVLLPGSIELGRDQVQLANNAFSNNG